ncbi:MAG: hypothetical protein K0S65_3500 [Labilithrix sp.]|nr:hypothetical protein [Labilithrix sp.]
MRPSSDAPRRPVLCGVAVAVSLLAPSTAFAGDPSDGSEPIALTYTAEARCPTYEQFVAHVRRYTTRWRLAGESTPHRSFRLVLAPSPSSGTIGKLELDSATSSGREIVGPDCEGVARALAIALAVMIDPEADLSGNAREPPAGDPPAAPGGTTAVPDEPPPSPAPRVRAAPRPSRSPPRRATPYVTLEGSLGVTTAVVGGLLPVLGATAELAPPPSHLVSWLQPSIGLGVRQSLPRDLDTSGLVSEFLWSAGVLRLCPLRLTTLGDRLELVPCLEVNAGILRASARGSTDAQTSTKPWLDFGGMTRVTFRVDGAWFVGLTIGVIAPFTRYRFELSNAAPVSQAPPTGLMSGACVGLRF